VDEADRLTARAAAPQRSVALLAAWIASLAVLTGGLTATIVYRTEIARAWPPSARLLGDPPPIAGPLPAVAGKPVAPAAAKPTSGPTEKAGPPRG